MDPLPVLNQPVHRSGALLDYLARRLRLRAESVLAPLGLRPRHLLAMTVLRDRGGSAQQALASTLEMDGTNIVGLLNDLEADGLIERKRSPEDRRRHIVDLTDAGIAKLARAEFVLAASEEDVLGSLTADQRETLYELLQQAVNGEEPKFAEDAGDVDRACVEDSGDIDRTCAEAAREGSGPGCR